ncbi:hypothetical protein OGAPHI_004431 [Ogataea philodendri]|uniref:1-(5-phosphoribosyl)-5-[(5-phosphoribosylamino)methylideneamino] imidazole-4-carboxamide isomerase n=1 Tax=Ogataea philodendri TaxID=1378263 RepID=A0A9P8P6M0_9ASCO|nr:uncharacterized protein OGAPHI_004431 [Ogataea philodendri]KAH3666242.1 hypothetical protein OGAPHI_004431 [Ogataea philodendri]
MTIYVGCIDIHGGKVKQIVGGTLEKDDRENVDEVSTNFVSELSSAHYAQIYKKNNIERTHVIKLGSLASNDEAATNAIKAWPNALQIGGGINISNAKQWIDKGAAKVIVTSWLFPEQELDWTRLEQLSALIGPERLVIDLSCRKVEQDGQHHWVVAMNKWQTLTRTVLSKSLFDDLSRYCSEFLVHAADVEGLCKGIDEELVQKLGEWSSIPVVYAGGAKSISDLKLVEKLSGGKVDLTYGSSLDLFGGNMVKFEDCCSWNKNHK